MQLRLSDLAAKLGLVLKGRDRVFSGLNTLENATEHEVSFLANPKYRHFLKTTKACAVILTEELAGEMETALISSNPYVDFARAASFFVHKESGFTGISPLAVIHPSAELGPDCTVHPHAHIGAHAQIGSGSVLFPGAYVGDGCRLGDQCILYPNAVLLAGVRLGDGCTIQPGAVVGTDGFGFTRDQGRMQKIPQIGTVVLADNVDIGANSCVDRSTLGATRIGRDTKLDNLVQIGHNVSLGEQCLIISQVGIAGSTKVGDRVTMAGQAGIAGHISIGDDVTIGPQAGVPKDIPSGTTGSGTPFMESRNFMRSMVVLPKLPDIYRRMQQMEKEIEALKEQLAPHAEKETS